MAEIDPDLRAAIAAYLRAQSAEATTPLPDLDPAGFAALVEMMSRSDLAHMFRMMHGMQGRYPTFEELRRGGMSMG
jgi:hypothetical protein